MLPPPRCPPLKCVITSDPDVTWQGSTTDDFLKSEEEFYSSYNPQIGLHTAAVLGGILGWLVVYLLYKTKVKKCVVRFVRKKYNQRKSRRKNLSVCSATGGSGNNESSAPPLLYKDNFSCFNHSQQQHNQLFQQPFPPHQQQFSQGQPGKNGDFSQTIPYTLCGEGAANLEDNLMGIQCPMPSIVVESCSSLPPKTTTKRARYKHKRAARSLDRKESSEKAVEQGEDHKHSGHKTRRKNRHEKKNYKQGDKNKKFNRKRSRSYSHQCPEVTVLDVDELDTKSLLLPPSSETDSARATARWVQNMPLLMQSYQDFTGLILKIEPNLVNQHKPQSCPLISAALQYAALPLPLLGLPNVSHLNKSMPLLTENGPGGHKDNELDSIFSDEKGSLGNHATLSASATNLSVPSLSPNPFLNPSAAMSAPASPFNKDKIEKSSNPTVINNAATDSTRYPSNTIYTTDFHNHNHTPHHSNNNNVHISPDHRHNNCNNTNINNDIIHHDHNCANNYNIDNNGAHYNHTNDYYNDNVKDHDKANHDGTNNNNNRSSDNNHGQDFTHSQKYITDHDTTKIDENIESPDDTTNTTTSTNDHNKKADNNSND
nr:hypothetical protein BaRGS_005076 [Batillaria attramentaria]